VFHLLFSSSLACIVIFDEAFLFSIQKDQDLRLERLITQEMRHKPDAKFTWRMKGKLRARHRTEFPLPHLCVRPF
jgi:hypothetical protein